MADSGKRPKIKIAKTKSEWIFDVIGYSAYIGSIILLVAIWPSLPDEVPAHYNAFGEVDRWGKKYELLILPIVGGFLLLMMQLFEKFPEIHNYPRRFNESNAAQFYLVSRQMLNQLKNSCLLLLAVLLFESISIALDWTNGMGGLFLPLLVVLTAIPIAVGIMRQRKIK
ncbi:DUF1648 domain-containing protein [Ornithinibacillus sp. BX22]|uniref:DUF1648 domain-containing protein n=2 Tax=Ornithinibacillus TaxID=484508 RepID=A0A923L4H2_9BACI|nr:MULTISPECIES: DUF1648 domain-containing protein [Ornithinibacillus]MBC5636241.1 DUF1648 domain-containing protein [Ornithinibacillus hominis]MBS3681082.1 DUF1648 domain-containing protein [Ornithinibacillus massiliensis]